MADRKVTVDVPSVPKGKNVTVPGLGVFPNGESTEVDENKYKRFQDKNPGFAGRIPFKSKEEVAPDPVLEPGQTTSEAPAPTTTPKEA
jgi:hypothetical protein